MDWRYEARCCRLDQALADRLFFGRLIASGAPRHTDEDVEAARHICEGCPVREACLSAALSVPERYDTVGIVAGLLPAERRRLRVEYRITPKAAEWHGGPTDVRRRRDTAVTHSPC